jgi:hypothetical protein
LWISGHQLIGAVFGDQYGARSAVGTLLMIDATLAGLATVAYYALTASGSFSRQPVLIAVVVIIGTAVTVLLTDRFGLKGTATGEIATSFVQLGLTTVLIARALEHRQVLLTVPASGD